MSFRDWIRNRRAKPSEEEIQRLRKEFMDEYAAKAQELYQEHFGATENAKDAFGHGSEKRVSTFHAPAGGLKVGSKVYKAGEEIPKEEARKQFGGMVLEKVEMRWHDPAGAQRSEHVMEPLPSKPSPGPRSGGATLGHGVPLASAPHPDAHEAVGHLVDRLRAVDARAGGYNLVHLADLRESVPQWTKAEFDGVLHRARRDAGVTLSPTEGRNGVSERDRAASVEDDAGGTTGANSLLYASLRR